MKQDYLKRVVVIVPMLLCLCRCTPRTAEDFFTVPWPSDTRVTEGNHILSSGLSEALWYPNAGPDRLTPEGVLAFNIFYKQGALKLRDQKYGVNTGVFFMFDESLDPMTLPQEPNLAMGDSSSVMLVNIDVDDQGNQGEHYGERIPLRLRFDVEGTAMRAPNTLALMPYYGFSLEQGSKYAAIVFNGVTNAAGIRLEKSNLLQQISGDIPVALDLTEGQLALWHEHKAEVDAYVMNETAWEVSDIVTFTVYSTQDVTKTAMAVRDGIASLSDADVLDLVVFDEMDDAENPSLNPSNNCNGGSEYIEITGMVRLPQWQRGCCGFLLDGGEIDVQYDEFGKVIIPGYEKTEFNLRIPCTPPTAEGNPYIVAMPGGSGGPSHGPNMVKSFMGNTSRPYDIVTISVGDYLTAENRAPAFAQIFWDLLKGFFPGQMDDSDFLHGVRNNFFNPLAASTNQIQAASETLILKRLVEAFESRADTFFTASELSGAGLVIEQFRLEKDNVGLTGFSQGANNEMINMAMDDGYSFAYIGSGSGLEIPQIMGWPEIRYTMENVFALPQGELNEFHPVVHIMQTCIERMDSINYVPIVTPKNLLAVAGVSDTQTFPEATQALATALARHGYLTSTARDARYRLLPVEGIETVLGLTSEEMPHNGEMISGIEGNLESGGTGIFSYFQGGHVYGAWAACGGIGEFLYTATHDDKVATVNIDPEMNCYPNYYY